MISAIVYRAYIEDASDGAKQCELSKRWASFASQQATSPRDHDCLPRIDLRMCCYAMPWAAPCAGKQRTTTGTACFACTSGMRMPLGTRLSMACTNACSMLYGVQVPMVSQASLLITLFKIRAHSLPDAGARLQQRCNGTSTELHAVRAACLTCPGRLRLAHAFS